MLDFLNESPFNVYLSVESPKVTRKINLPLGDIDLPDDLYITSNGNILAKSTTPEIQDSNDNSNFIINNTEEHNYNNSETEILSEDKKASTNKKISTNTKGNRKKAMNFFISKGLSAHAAAGIVGNLMLESGDSTLTKTDSLGDNKSAYGIAQWRLDRRKALNSFAKQRRKPISDFDTLLEFLWYELNSSHKSALTELLNSKNTKDATIAFMNEFEKPSPDPKINGINTRIKYAESLLT